MPLADPEEPAPTPLPPLEVALEEPVILEAVVEGEEIEEFALEAEEPQVAPVAEEAARNLWPLLLLLLVPALLWFLLARLVLVRVPDEKGKFETVARKLARRKDKRWFVNIEKELEKYLAKHGEVMVDFRGGLIKDAKKAVFASETVLGEGEKRFALVDRNRSLTWVDELREEREEVA